MPDSRSSRDGTNDLSTKDRQMTDLFKPDLLSANGACASDLLPGGLPDVPTACLLMSGWKPEGWEAPSTFGSFPILDVCPDAPALMAKAGHFTARDLKGIVTGLQLDIDHRNAEEIYRYLLKKAGDDPWILPVLETYVASHRKAGRPTGTQKRDKARRALSKMPLIKLRLESHPEFHDRLAELAQRPVSPDIALAAFCEYAIAAYSQRIGGDRHGDVSKEALALLHSRSSEIAVTEKLREIDIEGDILVRCAEMCRLIDEYPDVEPYRYLARILEWIQSLALQAEQVKGEPEVAVFDAMAMLSERGKVLARKAAAPRRDRVMEQLGWLGVEPGPEQIDDQRLELLDRLFSSGLSDVLEERHAEIEEMAAEASDLREQTQAASKAEDYELLGELAPRTKAAIAAHDKARADLARMLSMLEQIVAGGEGDAIGAFDELLDLVLDAIAELEGFGDEDGGPSPSLRDGLGHSADAGLDDDPVADDAELEETDPDLSGLAPDRDETAHRADDDIADELAPTSPIEVECAGKKAALPDMSDGAEQETRLDVACGSSSPEDGNADAKEPEAEETAEHDEQQAAAPEVAEAHPGGAGKAEPSADVEPEAKSAPAAPDIPEAVLIDLLSRDLLATAADAAKALEARGQAWPLSAAALRVAAASRAPHGDFGDDQQRFLGIANQAIAEVTRDEDCVLLLSAMLRPALLDSSSGLRNSLSGLCRGSLGQHLQQASEAIAALGFDFPPGADVLTRLSGTQRAPRRQRLAEQIGDWCEMIKGKTSRWNFATVFMHHVVSELGLIGQARAEIERGAGNPKRAIERARHAIEALSTVAQIMAQSAEFAATTGRTGSKLHSKGAEYLHRQFSEALVLLSSWISLVEREGGQVQASEERLRETLGNLRSRLEKAHAGLSREVQGAEDALDRALARWAGQQIVHVMLALDGADSGTFSSLDEALGAERDLWPAVIRDAFGEVSGNDPLCETLAATRVPDPHEAFEQALAEGAFATAARLSARFDLPGAGEIERQRVNFADTWEDAITERERQLKVLSKVDYRHQDEITRHLSWCEIARQRLADARDAIDTRDLSDIPALVGTLGDIVALIRRTIRDDQFERIRQYRTTQNAEEADRLLGAIEALTVEATEDRIAQLRDGRSAASFEADLQGMLSGFAPEFLDFATSAAWPSFVRIASAVKAEGPLYIEEDRRAAGLDFIGLYHDITTSVRLKKPEVPRLRAFFEEIGFEQVKFHGFGRVGRANLWQANLGGTIRPGGGETWFLPPVFGSQASAGYRLLLVGEDVLPEALIKALSHEVPSILLMCGVVDAARRHELASRLRSGALPALLIDEALTVFAATRRESRARTIFECGLPYGRVEPYTTDAGALPPEMFFGRGQEIRHIMSKTADGCLVYGGRQLGKSALLAHVERTQHAPGEDRIVVRRDVKSLGNAEKSSEIWNHLASMLCPDVVREGSRGAEAVSRDIRDWTARKPRGRILCMFDEADHFMDAETETDYPELTRLKELMEVTGRAFKVVFAGLHNVQRMYRQPNSPLAHLGQPICIGPLNRTEDDKRAAHDLVLAPMRAAGFRFETGEAIEEILSWANYYPSLVQEYMKGLLATLHGAGSGKTYRLPEDGPLWPVAGDTLFTHRGFNHIESRIREKFHLTLNLDPRYALVAFTLGRLNAEGEEDKARVTGFRPEDLLAEAEAFWPKTFEIPALAGFEALLEELFDLGILGRVPIPGTKRFSYLLASRQVATMLGSEEDIYHALAEIEQKDPPVAHDRAINRRPYTPGGGAQGGDGSVYAPLTDLQIERILHEDAVPVQIICGLDILGLSRVSAALKNMADTSRLPGARQEKTSVHLARTAQDLRREVDRARPSSDGAPLVIYAPDTVQEAGKVLSFLEAHPSVIQRSVLPLVLLDAADAGMRALAIRRTDQSQFLSAWGGEMLRVHLHHVEATALDTPSCREAILEAAGGVPLDTVKLVRKMRTADEPMAVAREWQPAAGAQRAALEEQIVAALAVLDYVEFSTADEIDEMMRSETGRDLVDIAPDLLAMGLVRLWQPRTRQILRSALGSLVHERAGG